MLERTRPTRKSPLARALRGAPAAEVEEWAKIEPAGWVLENARLLRGNGLTPDQARDLYRRLDTPVADDVGRLVAAGRMADVDVRWLHWWAASGLLRVIVVRPPTTAEVRRPRRTSYSAWASQARRYIQATGGDQEMAALAAAAHLTVEETEARHAAGELDKEALAVLVALRESLTGPDPMEGTR